MLKQLTQSKTFIIAEAGVNHNGDIALAKKLVDVAKKIGADAVKFQTWNTEELIVKGTKTAEYQQDNTGEADQFKMLKELELNYDEFRELQKYADKQGIMFLSTPDEEKSLNFLSDELDLPLIKIGSSELTNLLYLRKISAKGKPMILSTGMGNLNEVKEAVKTIEGVNLNPDLAILHCTTNYPCPLKEVNLNVLKTYKQEFPNYVIGYSDHTQGIIVSLLAVALGAKIIEKHFTLDNNMEGPDHKASLNPDEFQKMIKNIRAMEDDPVKQKKVLEHPEAEKILGSPEKKPTDSEQKIRPVVQKIMVAKNDLSVGTIISEEDITAKRTSQAGLEPNQYQKILGKKLVNDVSKDQVLIMSLLA